VDVINRAGCLLLREKKGEEAKRDLLHLSRYGGKIERGEGTQGTKGGHNEGRDESFPGRRGGRVHRLGKRKLKRGGIHRPKGLCLQEL